MTPERRNKINRVLNHRQPDLTVVLENVHDPHNISAVMRTCDAVGVQEIFVLTTVIGRHEKFGKKSSASAAGWLTIHEFESTEECVKALHRKGYRLFATHLGEDAVSLHKLDLVQPMAMVFGNEHDGVTDELLKHCDGNFIIPQVGMIQSLNISVACAVSLYEAFRQRSEHGYFNGESRLPDEQHATLSKLWGLTGEQ
ncbi:MAG: RNA methyltransferase [Sphingobacteriales bacterium]|nr:MAG: RNA methyltransferase [Sphingobacteriales bacterium]